jgi:CDP-diacylglycerol--glycerol-3-phosphate 3-phosphatidyltransferase
METNSVQSQILTLPNLVSSFRLGIIPVQFYLARNGQGGLFLTLFVAQLLSDLLDGLLARWLNQSSKLGARLDSWADLATYMSLPLCAWWLWPELIRRESPFLIAAVAAYLVPVAIGFLKFGRLTSYHTWISKASSVLMAPGLLIIFLEGPAWPFRLATCVFVLSVVEEIAMTAVLPNWRADVPTLWHAIKIAQQGERRTESDRSDD